MECTCKKCSFGCGPFGVPGRFLPGEAETAAAFMQMDLVTFFKTYLRVEYTRDPAKDDLWMLAPAAVKHQPGRESPAWSRGQCVFYKDERCSIHAVKPYECRAASHADTSASLALLQEKLEIEWSTAQMQIRQLLGRPPVKHELSIRETLLAELLTYGIGIDENNTPIDLRKLQDLE